MILSSSIISYNRYDIGCFYIEIRQTDIAQKVLKVSSARTFAQLTRSCISGAQERIVAKGDREYFREIFTELSISKTRNLHGGQLAGFTPLTEGVIKELCDCLSYLFTLSDIKRIVSDEKTARDIFEVLQQEFDDV